MPYSLFHNDLWFWLLQLAILAASIYFNFRPGFVAWWTSARKIPAKLSRWWSRLRAWIRARWRSSAARIKAWWRWFWRIPEGNRTVTGMGAAISGSSTMTATLTVERSEKSMAVFFGAYIFINGLVVAICLNAGPNGYEIFWALLDSALIFESLVVRPTGRNLLLALNSQLRIES